MPLLSSLLPYRKLAAALALVWLGWYAHAVVTEAGHAKELREQIEARTVAEKRANDISRQSQELQDLLTARNRELAKGAAHETTKPDYRTRLPDAGRLLYNAACCGDSAGQPDGPVPATDAPR